MNAQLTLTPRKNAGGIFSCGAAGARVRGTLRTGLSHAAITRLRPWFARAWRRGLKHAFLFAAPCPGRAGYAVRPRRRQTYRLPLRDKNARHLATLHHRSIWAWIACYFRTSTFQHFARVACRGSRAPRIRGTSATRRMVGVFFYPGCLRLWQHNPSHKHAPFSITSFLWCATRVVAG